MQGLFYGSAAYTVTRLQQVGQMPVSDRFVSVIAPLHNDSDIVEAFTVETLEVLRAHYSNYELVFVDDGSKDDTVAKVSALLSKHECMRLMRLSRTYGEEIAISAGLDSVIGDFVVIISPNSDPPRLIPEIVEKAESGYDMVFGIANTPARLNLLQRLGSAAFYGYCSKILKLDFPRGATQFRVLTRQAVNALTQIRDRHRYLRYTSHYVGFVIDSFNYDTLNRRNKLRKKGFLEAANLAINVIISSSKHPFRIVTWFGILAGALNMLYVGYIILIYVLKDDVAEGWTTLSLQQAVMFLFIFVILAIVSEYVGHILDETRNRPLYYILDEKTSSVMIVDEHRRNVVRQSRAEQLGLQPGQPAGSLTIADSDDVVPAHRIRTDQPD